MKPRRTVTTQMFARKQRVFWTRLRLMTGAPVEDLLEEAQRRFDVCAATARRYIRDAWDGFEDYTRDSREQVREMRRAVRANCLRWIKVADENMTRRVVRRKLREGTPERTKRCVDEETVTESVNPAAVRLADIANRQLAAFSAPSATPEEAARLIVDFAPSETDAALRGAGGSDRS